jgi:hypothetical protein
MWAIVLRTSQVRGLFHEIEVTFIHGQLMGGASHTCRCSSSGSPDNIEVAKCRLIATATARLPTHVSVTSERDAVIFVSGKRHRNVVSVTKRSCRRGSPEEQSSPRIGQVQNDMAAGRIQFTTRYGVDLAS